MLRHAIPSVTRHQLSYVAAGAPTRTAPARAGSNPAGNGCTPPPQLLSTSRLTHKPESPHARCSGPSRASPVGERLSDIPSAAQRQPSCMQAEVPTHMWALALSGP